jgi:hypothetical protein
VGIKSHWFTNVCKCHAEYVNKVYFQLGVNELVGFHIINAFFNSLKVYKTHTLILPDQLFGSLHILFCYAVLSQIVRALLHILLCATVT